MPIADHQASKRGALLDETAMLVARGPRSRQALMRLADRGDWRERTLAISALGQMARRDPRVSRPFSLLGNVLARVPGLRATLPTVGRRGALVIGTIHNAVTSPFFATRTAAALAIGECRHVASVPLLRSLLADRFEPVRRAAAVALTSLGDAAPAFSSAYAQTPAEIMPGELTATWLAHLTARHLELFGEAPAVHGLGAQPTAAGLAAWLAGPLEVLGTGGAKAEAERYADEPDLEHQGLKPFGAHDRAESLQQLDAFVALAAHLDFPAGALVLDVGGGSGWVGELLARYGFRTAVLDVSLPLLALARTRLAPGTIPAIAADMMALPIRSATADAIMVIDALHHVHDYEAFVVEAYRVLKPGGVLLLAEPGQGHPEAPQSLAEARHHHVREGAIDPQALGHAAATAGFAEVDLLPRIPAAARLPVTALDAAVRSPADRWLVTVDGSVTRFDALATSSMLARPMMVMRKGSRVAAPGAAAGLRAVITPTLTRHADLVTGQVAVTNRGTHGWRAVGAIKGSVTLGVQLLSPDGAMITRDHQRVPLPHDVPAGGQGLVSVQVRLPDATAPFRVKLDLVAEQVCWFEEAGSEPALVDL